MSKCSGIYKIQSISKPERVYIGSAVNTDKRWRNHLFDLKNNIHHTSKLQNHYNKYGEGDLIFEVIIKCNPSNLIEIEQLFIDNRNPYFNTCKVAGSSLGTKRKPEQVAMFIGNKYGAKNKGNKRPDLSEMNRRRAGQKYSDETKEKHRNIMMGNSFGKAGKGTPRSAETKKRMREAWVIRKQKYAA